MGADTITLGPPAASQVVGTEGLILDRSNNVLYSFGQGLAAAAMRAAMLVLGPQTALTAITTAQTLLSKAFGAGFLSVVGRTLHVRIYFIYTTAGTTQPVITFALTLGGVTLCSIPTVALSATAGTNLGGMVEFDLTVATAGSAGTIEAHGFTLANFSTAGSGSGGFNDTNAAVSSAINLTTALTLTATVAATLAVSSLQVRQATVEVVA